MLDPVRIASLEPFLLELNHIAGEVIRPLFRAEHGVTDKGGVRGFDPVTEADRGAEAAIRRAIATRFPDHGVVGEEYGEDRPDAEFVWVLDPVDGTRAFISGLPLWTTLIALRWQGRPVLGSIGQSFLQEVFIGHAGAARLVSATGERALAVRPCPSLGQAIIASTDPDSYFSPQERQGWTSLRSSCRLARLGCDAYAFAMVALGTMDLVLEAGLKCWDIEAAIPLIEGAGGVVTDWRGQPVGPAGGQVLIAGDRRAHQEALERLGG